MSILKQTTCSSAHRAHNRAAWWTRAGFMSKNVCCRWGTYICRGSQEACLTLNTQQNNKPTRRGRKQTVMSLLIALHCSKGEWKCADCEPNFPCSLKTFCHLDRVNRDAGEEEKESTSESYRAGLDPFPCDMRKAARATNGCNVVRGKSLDCWPKVSALRLNSLASKVHS